jgi:hypothetical protein
MIDGGLPTNHVWGGFLVMVVVKLKSQPHEDTSTRWSLIATLLSAFC